MTDPDASDTSDVQSDPNVQVTTGTGSSGGQGFRATATPMVRVVSPQSFADLWDNLEATGLFKLPRYSGSTPPKDASYFELESEGQRWIFRRPSVPSGARLDPDSPETQAALRWQLATSTIVQFIAR